MRHPGAERRDLLPQLPFAQHRGLRLGEGRRLAAEPDQEVGRVGRDLRRALRQQAPSIGRRASGLGRGGGRSVRGLRRFRRTLRGDPGLLRGGRGGGGGRPFAAAMFDVRGELAAQRPAADRAGFRRIGLVRARQALGRGRHRVRGVVLVRAGPRERGARGLERGRRSLERALPVCVILARGGVDLRTEVRLLGRPLGEAARERQALAGAGERGELRLERWQRRLLLVEAREPFDEGVGAGDELRASLRRVADLDGQLLDPLPDRGPHLRTPRARRGPALPRSPAPSETRPRRRRPRRRPRAPPSPRPRARRDRSACRRAARRSASPNAPPCGPTPSRRRRA